MPVTELKPRTSRKALLAAAKSMPAREFNQFWEELREWRAQRVRFHPGETERELLERIRKPFPADKKREMSKLVPQLEAETIGCEDSKRLREIAFERETWHAERMQALVDLANLRGMTLDEVMADLGIKLPEDA